MPFCGIMFDRLALKSRVFLEWSNVHLPHIEFM